MGGMGKPPSAAGRRLARLRRQKGLSLRALAALTGVPFTTIHSIERGQQQRVSIAHARALAPALGVDLLDLVPELRIAS